MGLIIGADIGGTSTKIAVTNSDGHLLAYAAGPGGNIRSASGDIVTNITETLARALDGLPRHEVRAAHLGIAGAGPARHAEIVELCHTIWHGAGISGPLAVQSDLEIAFASAARGREGLLLLSGTGAVACQLRNLSIITRSDGMGWLLGDVGSAVWLGLRALEASAAAMDGRGPRTSLVGAILAHLRIPTDGHDPRQALIAAVYPRAIADHGQLAPLVVECAESGDLVATQILDTAVAGLLATARSALREAPAAHPSQTRTVPEVVLAGSLLTSQGAIRTRVLTLLTTELGIPVDRVRDSRAPVVGAVRLAAAVVPEATVDLPALAAAILSQADSL